MSATRRPRPECRALLIAAVMVLAVTLAACGGDGEEPAARGTGADTASVFPVTVTHKFGASRIDAEPKRVVTVGYNDHDFVLALGVKPVAVREWFGERPQATWSWARDELGDAKPKVLSPAELNFEQIAALRPDLIVGVYSGITKSDYKRLSRIAPTVAQTDEHVDFAVPWQEQTRMIGRALGHEQRAEQLVNETEARLARARDDHPEFAKATALFAYREKRGSFGVYASDDPRGRFLRSLGFQAAEDIDKLAGDQFFAQLSGEQTRLLDRDVLVMIDLADVAASRDELMKDPLYRRLDVVKDGRDVYPPVDAAAALSFSSPLSLPLAIDAIVPQLARAVDRLGTETADAG